MRRENRAIRDIQVSVGDFFVKSQQKIEVIFSSGRAGTKIDPIQKGTGISLIFYIRGSIKLRICLFAIEMAVPGLLWQSGCEQHKSL